MKLTPATATFTSTSPERGLGRSMSLTCRTAAGPAEDTRTARMECSCRRSGQDTDGGGRTICPSRGRHRRRGWMHPAVSFRPICLSRLLVVRVGEVQSGGGDVVDLLARTGRRLRDVDDLQDLGTAEAGDLDSAHTRHARGSPDRGAARTDQGPGTMLPVRTYRACQLKASSSRWGVCRP